MVSLNLAPELDADLSAVAARLGKTKTALIETAIEEYLDDLYDQALAEEGMRDYDPSENVPLEVVKRELGLDS